MIESLEEMEKWLDDNDIEVSEIKDWDNGNLLKLKECPFSNEHKDGAYIIYNSKCI